MFCYIVNAEFGFCIFNVFITISFSDVGLSRIHLGPVYPSQLIHCSEKDGDLAHNNRKNPHKLNAQKNFKNFKPCIYNCVSTGMKFAKIRLSMCAIMALLGSQVIVVKCAAAILLH